MKRRRGCVRALPLSLLELVLACCSHADALCCARLVCAAWRRARAAWPRLAAATCEACPLLLAACRPNQVRELAVSRCVCTGVARVSVGLCVLPNLEVLSSPSRCQVAAHALRTSPRLERVGKVARELPAAALHGLTALSTILVTELTPDAARVLALLPALVNLRVADWVESCGIVRPLKRLRRLAVRLESDAGVYHLAGLTDLRHLDLALRGLTDAAAFARLGASLLHLEELSLQVWTRDQVLSRALRTFVRLRALRVRCESGRDDEPGLLADLVRLERLEYAVNRLDRTPLPCLLPPAVVELACKHAVVACQAARVDARLETVKALCVDASMWRQAARQWPSLRVLELETLTSARGVAGSLAALTCLTELRLRGVHTLNTREELAAVGTLPSLQSLAYMSKHVTDLGAQHLSRLGSLRELRLGAPARLTTLGALACLPTLRGLAVAPTRPQLEDLLRGFARCPLQRLELRACDPDDACLAKLVRWPRLRELRLEPSLLLRARALDAHPFLALLRGSTETSE